MSKIKTLFNKMSSMYNLYTKGGVVHARKLGVQVGKNCRIYTSSFGSEPFLIKIGDKVTVTSGVKFITHDGSTWLMNDEKGRRYLYQPIEVKDNVFIGVNSIIMPGVIIESNVIVAAGSVVTKSIPERVVVAGVPAKIIGTFDAIQEKILSTCVSDADLDKTLDYKSRILKVVNKEPKPYLKK